MSAFALGVTDWRTLDVNNRYSWVVGTADGWPTDDGRCVAWTTDDHGVSCNLIGLHWQHRRDNGWCGGGVYWVANRGRPAIWTLVTLEPLTVRPSLLCDCGAHGWITDGGWVPA